jgi:hypothetical protein
MQDVAKVDQVPCIERFVSGCQQLIRVHFLGNDLSRLAIPSDPFPFVLPLNFCGNVFGRWFGFRRHRRFFRGTNVRTQTRSVPRKPRRWMMRGWWKLIDAPRNLILAWC